MSTTQTKPPPEAQTEGVTTDSQTKVTASTNLGKKTLEEEIWTPHTTKQPSLLSSRSKIPVSYKGLLNLSLLILIVTNFRLAMENFFRYGIIVSAAPFAYLNSPYEWPGLTICILLNIHILLCLFIEKIASYKLSTSLVMILHMINLFAELTIPAYLVNYLKPVLGSGIVVTLLAATVWLKLFSYVHTNYNLRQEYFSTQTKTNGDEPDTSKLVYPKNLTLRNIYYFMVIPTLCYQIWYPFKNRINKRLLLKRILVFISLSLVVYLIAHQYIYPAVVNSVPSLDQSDYPKVIERVLKTSVPNLYVWLLGFYVFFELWLNIVAELTMFGDRKFFGDWWNAKSLGYYWRTWNLPVHYWMRRHVFKPLYDAGYSRTLSIIIAFFISAFFHEYILAVPFGKIKGWAFFGMLGQVPLLYMTEHLRHYHYVGNVIFWISIVLGQPMLVLLYYREYVQSTINP